MSNLINYKMDTRFAALAQSLKADYTRYADDLTFSFIEDNPQAIPKLIRMTKIILKDFGYELHQNKKLRIRRRHQQQMVTGIVVNKKIALPRFIRHWLRAVEHRMSRQGSSSHKQPTINKQQFKGWQAFQNMIESQNAIFVERKSKDF